MHGKYNAWVVAYGQVANPNQSFHLQTVWQTQPRTTECCLRWQRRDKRQRGQ